MSDLIVLKDYKAIQTDIFNYRSKEFFVNLKSSDIPTPDSEEFDDFVAYEEFKCDHGVTINGIHIPYTLYFHLNHWKLLIDKKDNYGKEISVMTNPLFRDNDWIIHNALKDCEAIIPEVKDEKELLVQGGCRQIGKTVTMASIISRDLTIRDNTTDLIVCSSQIDIDAVTKYIFAGMDATTDFLRIPRITLGKDEDTYYFGHKNPDGTNVIKSTLLTRNTQGGSKTQVSAGTTIFRGVFDEIGKSQMLIALEAMKPAMRGRFGFRSAGMLTFTGGEVEKSKDAETAFYHPASIGAKEFDTEGKKTGLFLSGLYRADGKRETTCGQYFNLPEDSELYNFPFYEKNEEKVAKRMADDLEKASKSPNPTPMIMHRIYYPMVTGDMFLTPNANPFPVDALLRHKEKLMDNPVGEYVELMRVGGKIEAITSNRKPIPEYPIVNQYVDKNAPIVVYSRPKYEENYNLHIFGFDPYNQDFTQDSDSLGSVYVMRRMHSDLTDAFQNCMVASYTARPTIKEFLRNLELLQEWYNGEILFEDSGSSVLSYFDSKNKGHVLMDTMDLQKEINPKSKAGNRKGLKANPTNNKRRLEALINYLEEDLGDGQMGLTRILDPLLIDELVAFNGMGEGTKNTDRVDGFSYAVLQLQSLQKFINHRPFIVDRQNVIKKAEVIIKNAFGFNKPAKAQRTRFGF